MSCVRKPVRKSRTQQPRIYGMAFIHEPVGNTPGAAAAQDAHHGSHEWLLMLRRDIVDAIAPRLSRQGFKILLDIVASSPTPLRVREIPCVFRPRLHGQSKLDFSSRSSTPAC